METMRTASDVPQVVQHAESPVSSGFSLLESSEGYTTSGTLSEESYFEDTISNGIQYLRDHSLDRGSIVQHVARE